LAESDQRWPWSGRTDYFRYSRRVVSVPPTVPIQCAGTRCWATVSFPPLV